MTTLVKEEQKPVAVVQSESSAMLAMIERFARDQTVDIARVEKMIELRERMKAQDAKEHFLADMAQMQAELPSVARRGTAHNNKKYARFEDIIDAVKPVMAKHGFSLTYRVTQTDKSLTVTGVLGHAKGHTEQTDMTLPADNTGGKNLVQAWGSSTTYGKRYVALTLLGIATEDDDDDGRAAAAVKRKSSAESKRDGTSARFNEIKVAFEQADSIDALRDLSQEHSGEINGMPEKWAAILSDTWDLRRDELKARMG